MGQMQGGRGGAVAVVFARNEAKDIATVLKPLQRWKGEGIIREVLVMDDASTDETGAIACRHGARVICLPEWGGKTRAFIAAVWAVHRLKAEVMVTFDADFYNLELETVAELMALVCGTRPSFHMAAAGGKQYRPWPLVNRWPWLARRFAETCGPDFSGVRAVRMEALSPLINGLAALRERRAPSRAFWRWIRLLAPRGWEERDYFERGLVLTITRRASVVGRRPMYSRSRGHGSHSGRFIVGSFKAADRIQEERNALARQGRLAVRAAQRLDERLHVGW